YFTFLALLALSCGLVMSIPTSARADGPNIVGGPAIALYANSNVCRYTAFADCGTWTYPAGALVDLYFSVGGNPAGDVTCSSTPWAIQRGQHYYWSASGQVTWSVTCTDSQ